jgi:hypothetical protein
MTTKEEEQFVRAHWTAVNITQPWLELTGNPLFYIYVGNDFTTSTEISRGETIKTAWHSAYIFTKNQLEQITAIKEAIEWNSEPFICKESLLIDTLLREKYKELTQYLTFI